MLVSTATALPPLRAPRTTPVRRLLVVVVAVLAIGGTALFAGLGCQQMRTVAPLGSTTASGRTVTGYTWSLHPLGFTVRYDDGSSATRLWW